MKSMLSMLSVFIGLMMGVSWFLFQRQVDRFVVEPFVQAVYLLTTVGFLLFGFHQHIPLLRILPEMIWHLGLFCCVSLLGLAGFAAAFPYGNPNIHADGTERVVLVLGAPVWENEPTTLLVSRSNAAAEWIRSNPDADIILSGGKENFKSEAEIIRQLLVASDIPCTNIHLETQSMTTDENFLYSAEILQQLGFSTDEPIAIATNAFHFFRLRWYAQKCGYTNLRWIIVPTPISTRLMWDIREAIVIVRYWLTVQ